LRAVDLGIPEDRYRGKRGDNLLVAPLTAEAQPAAKGPRVGWLSDGLRGGAGSHLHEAFLHGLRDLGYVKGQNIVVERRDVEGKLERLPDLAAELVRLKVDVIVTMGVPGISAAKRMTGSIPIVMADAGDPVGTGLVASLARPGGNLTGVFLDLPELSGNQLELLDVHHNHIVVEGGEFGGERGKPLESAIGESPLNRNILALDVAQCT
jgi:putative tryptophan/tyrosine transport system substrate-binding protein